MMTTYVPQPAGPELRPIYDFVVEGVLCFAAGSRREDNPYGAESRRWKLWNEGWDDGAAWSEGYEIPHPKFSDHG